MACYGFRSGISVIQQRIRTMHYLYLLINLSAVCIPFIFSFHRKINFHKQFYAAIPAILISAICFILWDAAFTRQGIWGFNSSYITGIWFFGLPAEEMMFFVCIPYACLFTYYCLTLFYRLQWKERTEKITCALLAVFLFSLGIIYFGKAYTCATCISTALLLVLFKFVLREKWLGKLLSIYPVLLIPFFIVNGLLTGTGLNQPVVWYNNMENMGIRLHTIPIEDVCYGFELIMLTVFFFERFSLSQHKN